MSKFNDIAKSKSVKDCNSLNEFLAKYRRADRYTQRNGSLWGIDYSERIDKSHQGDIDNHGFTSISQYESNSGKAEYYFPKNQLTMF